MAGFLLSLAASALSKLGDGRSNEENDVSSVQNTNENNNDVNVTNCEKSTKGNIYTKAKSIEMRQRYICGANKLFFKDRPLKIVRGEGTYMIDEEGNYILDCINNVACVGHCHPDVVKAGADQMALLSTNNRYLHDNILLLAETLIDSFQPLNPQLTSCLFVNSGSEANDLALRMARTHSGGYDVMVLQNAYHGHVVSCIEMSPYKFDLPGGGGKVEHVHVVEIPDTYRGKYRDCDYSEDELRELYLGEVKNVVKAAKNANRKIAAFFVEGVQSCGGQIVYPHHWMRDAFDFCRQEGIVSIADEVQTGFGRAGTHFWSYQSQDVQPDIVVMGKPMGNGHPISCVVTTQEIADSFAKTGVEYFNTFGGNPVSCAIALGVIGVIKKEKLQENARLTGQHLLQRLKELSKKHSVIGDIRGHGLMVGIDLTTDPVTRQPNTALAKKVKEAMLGLGVLLSTDGPHENVLKMKPPLVFGKDNADEVVDKLDLVITDLTSNV